MDSATLRNYKLILAYDGTPYHGWQIQPNGISIQQKLQEAIKIALRQEVHVIGSGRTDSGVHALAQTANFICHEDLDLYRFLGSLNGLLPQDIRVKEITDVPLNFHAQHSAIGKTYHYHLHLDPIMNPFKRLYAFHVRDKVKIELFYEAAKYFVGTHDFIAFANEAHTGCAAYDSVRTMKRLDVVVEEGGVRLEFEADGFLYKMVRNIVGTLLEIASGKRDSAELPLLFEKKDRRLTGKAALPHGLFLVKVDY